MEIINHIAGVIQGKHSIATARSSHWPTVRKEHLKSHPVCEVCGGSSDIEVHHIHPFHIHPELELDLSNLITLCESKKNGINCHLLMGHLGNFKSFNADVSSDAMQWNKKLHCRPTQQEKS